MDYSLLGIGRSDLLAVYREPLSARGSALDRLRAKAKKGYKRAMLAAHPDRGGTAEAVQAVTDAYDAIKALDTSCPTWLTVTSGWPSLCLAGRQEFSALDPCPGFAEKVREEIRTARIAEQIYTIPRAPLAEAEVAGLVCCASGSHPLGWCPGPVVSVAYGTKAKFGVARYGFCAKHEPQ